MTKNKDKIIPKRQRALILQGGGALGAYEAGAFKALTEIFLERNERNGERGRPLFDIIAGTSVGAINAGIIVSHFVNENKKNYEDNKNSTWNESADDLLEFWKFLSSPTTIKLEETPWAKRKGQGAGMNKVASHEAARRYYSSKKNLIKGAHGVFDAPTATFRDDKFFDDEDSIVSNWLPDLIPIPNTSKNVWLRYDGSRLEKSIQTYRNFPIKTSYAGGQPRLLVVTVDVAEGKTETFDSYKHKGIDTCHIMASSAVPLFYNYREISGRKFWDGGILSNTPVREVIEAHKNYWEHEIGQENLKNFILSGGKEGQKIPDLELFIVNVISSRVETVPTDHDGAKDRLNDLRLLDKSEYDIRVAATFSQHVDLIKQLIDLGENDPALKNRIANILTKSIPKSDSATTTSLNSNEVRYIDAIKTSFKISKVIRINRAEDPNTISNKFVEFTEETIDRLIYDGMQDAKVALEGYTKIN